MEEHAPPEWPLMPLDDPSEDARLTRPDLDADLADPFGLLVSHRADSALCVAERSHAEEPKRTGGKRISVSRNERICLGRPRLVIHRRTKHDRVVTVKHLDLLDRAQIDGGPGITEARGDPSGGAPRRSLDGGWRRQRAGDMTRGSPLRSAVAAGIARKTDVAYWHMKDVARIALLLPTERETPGTATVHLNVLAA